VRVARVGGLAPIVIPVVLSVVLTVVLDVLIERQPGEVVRRRSPTRGRPALDRRLEVTSRQGCVSWPDRHRRGARCPR